MMIESSLFLKGIIGMGIISMVYCVLVVVLLREIKFDKLDWDDDDELL